MKRICFILFLFIYVTSYSQTFWYPIWMKSTVKMTGIPGTGTLLGIDGLGNVSKVTGVGAAGVTGLNDYEPLFGSLTGTIEQDNFWYYDPTTQFMRLGDPAGTAGGEIYVVNGTTGSYMTPTSVGVTGSVGQTYMDGQYFNLYDLDGEFFSIGRATWSADEVLLFPAAKGALNQSLYVSNVSGDNVTFSWYTPATGTVTSIATTSPIGGGTITSTGTLNLLASGADKYLYSTGVNTWAEGAISTYSRGLLDEVDNLGWYSTLDISANTNEILFGLGTNITSSGNLTFDGTIFALGNGIDFHMARFEVGNLGVIEKYSNSTATDGTFFIGNSGSGAWETGTITSSDITIGYSNPNIELSISGLDAAKINTGVVSNTEFNYLDGVTSAIQTQLDARSKVVATSHLTSRNAAIAATTLYAVPADGFYTITVQLAVTTTGGTSIGTQIRFTNVADNVVKTLPSNNSNGLNQCASSTTANAVCYTITAYCKSGTNIQYITNLAGSGQVYSLDAQVVKD